MYLHSRRVSPVILFFLIMTGHFIINNYLPAGETTGGWIQLFNGHTLQGWKTSENNNSWKVKNGRIIGHGKRSRLFYTGSVSGHDFCNFELKAEVKAGKSSNSGIFFHTRYQESGWPKKGYEVQINNTYMGTGKYRELKHTGSLYGVRNIYKSFIKDNEWFRIKINVTGKRIRIWINDLPTVDYIQPEFPIRAPSESGRILSHGTIALQAHDPGSTVFFRSIQIRSIPGNADPMGDKRASDKGYGITKNIMDRLSRANFPFLDYHVHLRGGMTVQKALDRQAVCGINCGTLKNIGKGWPIETDVQLRRFLHSVQGKPLFVGIQVNDRDWMVRHNKDLLKQLDYVLGDTMIMPMPNDDSPPVKLWIADKYTIDDPETWMKRYMRHNLKILKEPITILANPTYLPPAVKDKYDELWTDKRMRKLIQAAINNKVALEINATSGLPHERFIRMAKKMGAKFTFGTNNFNDKPIDMSRCFNAITRYKLTKDDMYVPGPKKR